MPKVSFIPTPQDPRSLLPYLRENFNRVADALAKEFTDADIADGSITTVKLGDGAVTSFKLADNSVTNPKVADNAINTAELVNSAVATAKLADDAVTNAKVADNAIDTPQLVDSAVITSKLGALQVTLAKLAADSVDTSKLVNAAITNAKLAALAVDTANIIGGAVTTLKLADLAVTTAKMANDSVNSDIIAAGAVTATEIATDAVTTPKILAGAIVTAKIAAGAVTANEIAANAIVAGKIAAGTIVAGDIAAATITGAKIASGTITAANILAGTITATEIAAATITGAKIAAGTITASNIQADTLTANEIATNAITANELNAGAVTTAKIAAGAVTANEIAANTITAAKIAAGTITATEIAAATITAAKLATGTLSAGNIEAGTLSVAVLLAGSIKTATSGIRLEEDSSGIRLYGYTVPRVRSVALSAHGTGNITPALPTGWVANDIFLMFVETQNEAVAAPAGWTLAPNSPQSDATDPTRLTVFYRRAVGGDTAPTITDPGDHCIAAIAAFSGCTTTGSPFDVTAGGTEATSDTSGSIPGATTTVPNTLAVVAACESNDVDDPDGFFGGRFSGWTNADLTDLSEIKDASTSDGNGGGFGVAVGIKKTAGAYGNTAVTYAAASRKGMWTGALKSDIAASVNLDAGTGQGTFTGVIKGSEIWFPDDDLTGNRTRLTTRLSTFGSYFSAIEHFQANQVLTGQPDNRITFSDGQIALEAYNGISGNISDITVDGFGSGITFSPEGDLGGGTFAVLTATLIPASASILEMQGLHRARDFNQRGFVTLTYPGGSSRTNNISITWAQAFGAAPTVCGTPNSAGGTTFSTLACDIGSKTSTGTTFTGLNVAEGLPANGSTCTIDIIASSNTQ